MHGFEMFPQAIWSSESMLTDRTNVFHRYIDVYVYVYVYVDMCIYISANIPLNCIINFYVTL